MLGRACDVRGCCFDKATDISEGMAHARTIVLSGDNGCSRPMAKSLSGGDGRLIAIDTVRVSRT